MRKVYGSVYDFSPHGYNLPLEYTKLAAECSRGKPLVSKYENNGYFDDMPVWICKPVAQSQGRGIFLFRKLSELNYDTNTIVQRYIERPLLIGGYKFDLRLYVCIPSYQPLTVYMYREGLTRFGTDKFTLNDLRNRFRHLTNSSINKLGPGYTEMKDRIGSGCKWTLRQLRRYFQQAGIHDWLLWQQISSLVILTLLSHVSQVPPTLNCFEFFGFDVLIDENLKPWLLEVNLSPALGNDCDTDNLVKKPLLHDMFDLLGLPIFNSGLSIYDVWNDAKEYKCSNDVDANNNQTDGSPSVRWRKRHRKSTASRSSSTSRSKSRNGVSSKGHSHNIKQKYMASIDSIQSSTINVIDLNANNFKTEPKKFSITKQWGNGRDWKKAPPFEGSWIRLWPFNLESDYCESANTKANIKQMVTEIIHFNKTAKELVKKYPVASECQLSEYLLQEVNLTRDIWIPPL